MSWDLWLGPASERAYHPAYHPLSGPLTAISSVITRDILPMASRRFRGMDQRRSLRVARVSTLLFMFLTLAVGIEAERFGGVLGLIISWFAALIGPVSVPMLFGLLPAFRNADARAAIASILAGFAAFVIVRYVPDATQALRVLAPIATSVTVFSAMAWLNRHRPVQTPVADLLCGLAGNEQPVDQKTATEYEHST